MPVGTPVTTEPSPAEPLENPGRETIMGLFFGIVFTEGLKGLLLVGLLEITLVGSDVGTLWKDCWGALRNEDWVGRTPKLPPPTDPSSIPSKCDPLTKFPSPCPKLILWHKPKPKTLTNTVYTFMIELK